MQLQKWLHSVNMTQAQFAKRLRVSERLVSHWCTGRNSPRIRNLIKVKRATEGHVDEHDFARHRQKPNGSAPDQNKPTEAA